MHIENFLYEFNVNENGEISCLIKVNGVKHSFDIDEKSAKPFIRNSKWLNQLIHSMIRLRHIMRMRKGVLNEASKIRLDNCKRKRKQRFNGSNDRFSRKKPH